MIFNIFYKKKVSHDLKTPLNGIIQLTEVALKTKDPDERKSLLKNIIKSG
jgi:signal transduction histidine kinase